MNKEVFFYYASTCTVNVPDTVVAPLLNFFFFFLLFLLSLLVLLLLLLLLLLFIYLIFLTESSRYSTSCKRTCMTALDKNLFDSVYHVLVIVM